MYGNFFNHLRLTNFIRLHSSGKRVGSDYRKSISESFENIIIYLMRYGVSSYLGLDEIGSPNPMMIFIIISYLFIYIF